MSARVGISIIGTPNGFESASIGASKSINMGRKVDLDNSVINILPNTDILMVRRDFENARLLTYITYYRFAKEIKASRTGSFYGSSILFENFVPSKIPFILKMLIHLADMVNESYIDPSENRFRSHINPARLEDFSYANPYLLDASTYQERELPLEHNISNRKCFLLLDKDVLDYESFLSKVILNDLAPRSNLSTYLFVYTSRHKEIIEEVRVRKGLKIETLTSLTMNYLADDLSRNIQPRFQQGEEFYTSPSQSKTPADEPTNDAPDNDPRPQNQLERQVNPEQSALKLGTPRADSGQNDRGSKIVIPIPSERPLTEQARDQETPDGWLVTRARSIERLYRSREADGESFVNRYSRVGVLLILILVAGLIGAFFVLSFITGGWPHFTDIFRGQKRTTVYYNGCLNSKGNEEGSSNALLKCQPQYVAEEFVRRLQVCDEFNTHLNNLKNTGGEDAKDAYREDIKKRITESITASTNSRGYRSEKNDASTLSSTKSTAFSIELDFNNSIGCINQIMEARDSDFARKLTDNSPSTGETPGAGSQANKQPSSTPALTSKSPNTQPTATPKPTWSPGSGTHSPENKNQNSNKLPAKSDNTQNSQPDAVQKPTPNQTLPNNLNTSQPTTLPPETKPEKKRGKKGAR